MADHAQEEKLVLARASIHLPGLPLGQAAFVDPADPYIADALEQGYLVQETVHLSAVGDG